MKTAYMLHVPISIGTICNSQYKSSAVSFLACCELVMVAWTDFEYALYRYVMSYQD